MSESDVVIRVEGLGKKYSLHHEQSERYTALRDVVARQAKAVGRLLNPFTLAGQLRKAQRQVAQERAESEEEFWALKDVSFEIRRGERVGIIGRNGAGKSTLLKILSRITEPTTGRVEIRGRVASLLEVGTGFHPELTGRENIYLNGAILGMARREIRSKFDEIVDFAEVEKFLDTPVKRYSSGMYVRLAFAVAAHLEPEILVVDEVLAVGDVSFQKKCLGKMEDVASKEQRTVIFVSHNMRAISDLCPSSILLASGEVKADGETTLCINTYLSKAFGGNCDTWERPKIFAQPALKKLALSFAKVEMRLTGSQPSHLLKIDCTIENRECPLRKPFLAFDIADSLGGPIAQSVGNRFDINGQSHITITSEISLPPLIPGTYSVSAWVGLSNSETLDWARDILSFEILDSPLKIKDFTHSPNHGSLSLPCVSTETLGIS
jgi:lipopolysaccharide transport system ATP-binding protein